MHAVGSLFCQLPADGIGGDWPYNNHTYDEFNLCANSFPRIPQVIAHHDSGGLMRRVIDHSRISS